MIDHHVGKAVVSVKQSKSKKNPHYVIELDDNQTEFHVFHDGTDDTLPEIEHTGLLSVSEGDHGFVLTFGTPDMEQVKSTHKHTGEEYEVGHVAAERTPIVATDGNFLIVSTDESGKKLTQDPVADLRERQEAKKQEILADPNYGYSDLGEHALDQETMALRTAEGPEDGVESDTEHLPMQAPDESRRVGPTERPADSPDWSDNEGFHPDDPRGPKAQAKAAKAAEQE